MWWTKCPPLLVEKIMLKEKKSSKITSAVVAEPHAQNNASLGKVIDALKAGYRTNRMSKANSTIDLRRNRVAMIPNDKPIYAHKKDGAGNIIGTKLLYRAGWYLSVEDNAFKETLLADPENRELNETIWAAMEEQGVEVEKSVGGSNSESKVVSGDV